jgi:BirA family biotin operon repressor/biotin-[acetyl-CoA-carboxylase] ligase
LAESSFDRLRFGERLRTRVIGRTLLVRAETVSTNDDAWAALDDGLPDGVTVVADAQTGGRGREGRAWTQVPGRGLALSVALHLGCDPEQAGLIPLAAGLALAESIARFGISPRLKWPNDVMLESRKLAGLLCERRRRAAGGEAVVIGAGVNVRHAPGDFPVELASIATSLAIAGVAASLEDVAAEFVNALEPRWTELQEGSRAAILEAWSARAAYWGEPVTVRTPAGPLSGVAQRLDKDGALVLRLASGAETRVLAGDLVAGAADGAEAR